MMRNWLISLVCVGLTLQSSTALPQQIPFGFFRAVVSAPPAVAGQYCVSYLTSGTSWTVPGNWNSADNIIEVIGAGGRGADGVKAVDSSSGTSGAGGGGGAYAKITNLTLATGASITYWVAAGGSQTDTYFNGTSLATSSVGAKAGMNGSITTAGAGGSAAASVGTTKYSGGNGGAGFALMTAGGGGGGGAAGPRGPGGDGGLANGMNAGAGGGGSDNGAVGGVAQAAMLAGSGGSSGFSASAGGTGATDTFVAGTGILGGGGGGGAPTASGRPGGNGSSGNNWGESYGPGGGGGAGSYGDESNAGSGGAYGGGGGGGGAVGTAGATVPGLGGSGGSGLIVIRYAAVSCSGTALADHTFTAAGGFVSAALKSTSSTTWTFTSNAQLNAGQLGVLLISSDNPTPLTGHTRDHVSITDAAGNTWTKLREYTNSPGSASSGATLSIWTTVATANLASGANITITFASGIGGKAATGAKFTITPGTQMQLAGAADVADGAVDPSSLSLSGLSSRQYLFIRAVGQEGSGTTWTPSSNYTSFDHSSSTAVGGSSDASSAVRGEFRIHTGSGDTTDPTGVAADNASSFIAIY